MTDEFLPAVIQSAQIIEAHVRRIRKALNRLQRSTAQQQAALAALHALTNDRILIEQVAELTWRVNDMDPDNAEIYYILQVAEDEGHFPAWKAGGTSDNWSALDEPNCRRVPSPTQAHNK